MRTVNEIRDLYLEYFKSKGHTIIPSASLIPENDPTVLFTTAGMHPLVPYLLGEQHPGGKKLASCQKCIRTGDIDEVGDDIHLTFFEMLGNWSLGDYFKEDAIKMSFEFLTDKKWLGLNKEKIAASVFAGDSDAPFDEEAFDIWKNVGISEKRIAKLPKKNNWWGPAGETGPCGPDTEMFYWTGDENDKILDKPFQETFEDKRWVEIWNDVFMQYNKTGSGNYKPLKQKNVDTGMGLERTTAVINKCEIYEVDVFKPIIDTIEKLSDKKYESDEKTKKSIRIIADHIRSATFILGDERGVLPSNVGQGYVLRRLIRRAVRYGKLIGMKDKFTGKISNEVIELFKKQYPELQKNKKIIIEEIENEEEKFAKTLNNGISEAEKIIRVGTITGAEASNLYQSYGFPIELTEELLKERGITINEVEFREEFKKHQEKHQELSRTASAGVFKGGLADNSEAVVKYHTATHIMLQAMREILGEHVEQRGSNLTAERMRFDFSHPTKVTPDEIKKIEDRVNEVIKMDLPVHFEILSVDEAKKRGATGIFEEKYAKLGNNIKVYFIGDYSKEICGGPHVEHTGILGKFKIQKEEAVASGIRRIKATLTQ